MAEFGMMSQVNFEFSEVTEALGMRSHFPHIGVRGLLDRPIWELGIGLGEGNGGREESQHYYASEWFGSVIVAIFRYFLHSLDRRY